MMFRILDFIYLVSLKVSFQQNTKAAPHGELTDPFPMHPLMLETSSLSNAVWQILFYLLLPSCCYFLFTIRQQPDLKKKEHEPSFGCCSLCLRDAEVNRWYKEKAARSQPALRKGTENCPGKRRASRPLRCPKQGMLSPSPYWSFFFFSTSFLFCLKYFKFTLFEN